MATRAAVTVLAVVVISVAALAEPPKPRVDAYGDALPEGAVARLGTIRFRLPGHTSWLSFSRDGKTLVTTGSGGLQVWDITTGKAIHRLPDGEDHALAHAVLSPDQSLYATMHFDRQTTGGRISLWEAATGQHVRDFGSRFYAALAFSPDGRRLVAYNENANRHEREDVIDVWEASTGGLISSWKAEQDGVIHAAFMKDGKRLITGGADSTIRFWDAENGKELRRLGGNGSPVGLVSLSADEKLLAAIDQRSNGPNTFPRNPPNALPWYAENRVRVWNLETGQAMFELFVERPSANKGVSGITSALFTPDGKSLITGGLDRKTRVWDPSLGKEVRCFDVSSDWGAALSPDGRMLAAYAGNAIRLIDLATGKDPLFPNDPPIAMTKALFLGDGKTVATAGYSRSRAALDRWDAMTGKRGEGIGECDGLVASAVLGADRKTLVTTQHPDGGIKLWDVTSKAAPRTIALPDRKFAGQVTLAPDGKTLAIGGYVEPTVLLLDVTTGMTLRELPGHTDGVRHLFFTADGERLVVGCANHTVRVWNLRGDREPKQIGPLGEPPPSGVAFPRDSGQPFASALSPDGRFLVYGHGDRSLALFDLDSGKQLYRVDLQHGPDTLAFSENGTLLAWGGYDDPAIHVLDAATGKERRQYSGHEGGLLSLSFSHDGKHLVSVGRDSTALVWEISTVEDKKP